MTSKISDEFSKMLEDPHTEDIVLSPAGVSVFKKGTWLGPFLLPESERAQLYALAQHIAEEAHIQLGLTQPTADSFLALTPHLKYRAHVAIPPLLESGPEITLRRLPNLESYSLDDFQIQDWQREEILKAVLDKKSILISGATGCGKTSFLTALMRSIPQNQRCLILEDSPELPLPNPLSSKLLCRQDRFGHRLGAHWSLKDLVFESLRMRPDRLIVGECRSDEAQALSQALRTGHRGVWATLHGGNCEEALKRFSELSSKTLSECRELWDCQVHLGFHSSGHRCVSEVRNNRGDTL
jgi:pilus assembly protein CpaF